MNIEDFKRLVLTDPWTAMCAHMYAQAWADGYFAAGGESSHRDARARALLELESHEADAALRLIAAMATIGPLVSASKEGAEHV